jgi:hypothetical protein
MVPTVNNVEVTASLYGKNNSNVVIKFTVVAAIVYNDLIVFGRKLI